MGWASMRERLDRLSIRAFNDGPMDFLDRQGAVIASGLAVIVSDGVERLGEIGAIDRYRTIAVQKHQLVPLDRQGRFRDANGKEWHIDDIHSDDGHLITFYVVP